MFGKYWKKCNKARRKITDVKKKTWSRLINQTGLLKERREEGR